LADPVGQECPTYLAVCCRLMPLCISQPGAGAPGTGALRRGAPRPSRNHRPFPVRPRRCQDGDRRAGTEVVRFPWRAVRQVLTVGRSGPPQAQEQVRSATFRCRNYFTCGASPQGSGESARQPPETTKQPPAIASGCLWNRNLLPCVRPSCSCRNGDAEPARPRLRRTTPWSRARGSGSSRR